jgi:hypothetical protein
MRHALPRIAHASQARRLAPTHALPRIAHAGMPRGMPASHRPCRLGPHGMPCLASPMQVRPAGMSCPGVAMQARLPRTFGHPHLHRQTSKKDMDQTLDDLCSVLAPNLRFRAPGWPVSHPKEKCSSL